MHYIGWSRLSNNAGGGGDGRVGWGVCVCGGDGLHLSCRCRQICLVRSYFLFFLCFFGDMICGFYSFMFINTKYTIHGEAKVSAPPVNLYVIKVMNHTNNLQKGYCVFINEFKSNLRGRHISFRPTIRSQIKKQCFQK